MNYFVAFFLILFSSSLSAQHIIKLKQKGKVQIPFVVSQVQVAFDLALPIGYVYRNGEETPYTTQLPATAEQDLRSFFQATDTSNSVIIRITSIQVSERKFDNVNKAYCSMHFEVLQQIDGQLYRIYDYTGNTVHSGMGDSTNDHDSNIAKCFQEGFLYRTRTSKRNPYTPVLLNETDTFSYVNTNYTYYEYPTVELNPYALGRGYFGSIMDMRAGNYQKLDEVLFSEMSVPGDMQLYKVKLKPKLDPKPYIIGNNSRLYMSIGKQYTPIFVTDTGCYVYLFEQNRDPGASNAAVLGGLLGYAIYSAANSNKARPSSEPELHKLDLITGKLTPCKKPDDRMGAIREEHTYLKKIIIKHSFFTKAKKGVEMVVNNEAKYLVPPDKHVELNLKKLSDSVHVAFFQEGVLLGEFSFNKAVRSEVLLVAIKGKKFQMTEQVGKAHNDILETSYEDFRIYPME